MPLVSNVDTAEEEAGASGLAVLDTFRVTWPELGDCPTARLGSLGHVLNELSEAVSSSLLAALDRAWLVPEPEPALAREYSGVRICALGFRAELLEGTGLAMGGLGVEPNEGEEKERDSGTAN